MALSPRTLLVATLALAALAGCHVVNAPPTGKSPLRPGKSSSDSIELEIFSAHFPHGDKEINGTLWSEVDEQRLPADTRRLLTEYGIRAGVVGGHPPDILTRLLKITDKPTKLDQKVSLADLDKDPAVSLRILPLRVGRRGEVVASQPYDELPLITRDEGQVHGRTYTNAECHLALRATPDADGRVSIELTPEVLHGDAKTKFVGAEGVLRLETGRPRQVFDMLRMTTKLAPGEMLIITALPDQSGCLGHYFFTEPGTSGLLQKMIVIRPSQGRPTGLFAEKLVDDGSEVIGE